MVLGGHGDPPVRVGWAWELGDLRHELARGRDGFVVDHVGLGGGWAKTETPITLRRSRFAKDLREGTYGRDLRKGLTMIRPWITRIPLFDNIPCDQENQFQRLDESRKVSGI